MLAREWSGASVGSVSGWDLARALVQEWQETSFCGLAALVRYWRGGNRRIHHGQPQDSGQRKELHGRYGLGRASALISAASEES